MFRGGFCLVLLLAMSGCHSPAPFLPINWAPKEINPLSLEDSQQAKLHVFIMYSSRMCSHTTLRIYAPGHGVVFWDPAGGYGTPEYPVVAKRRSDLVVDPIPSVLEYIDFRQYLPTSRAEIFEFNLSGEKAIQMIDILRSGKHSDGGRFITRTDAFYCSSSISEFLERYAGDEIRVTKEFFPHNLARQLYQNKPARVFIYDKKGLYRYDP